MSSAVTSLLVLGVIVLVTGLFVLGDSQDKSHRVIKPSRPKIGSSKIGSRTSSKNTSGTVSSAVKPTPKKDGDSTTDRSISDVLEEMTTPNDPFDRVTTDGESTQARDARATARDLADTDPARLVHIIRKWRQEDEGSKFR